MREKSTTNYTTFTVLTALTLLTWVLVEAYLRFKQTVAKPVPEEILKPLDSSLDRQTLDTIESKLFFTEGEIQLFVPTTSGGEEEALVPSPQPSPTPTASPSAEASPSAQGEQ